MMPIIFLKKRKAQNYFDLEIQKNDCMKINSYVTEKLLDFNSNPKGNPYVGQDQIGANKFIIKVKILNHRWIIADYSDGEMWERYYLNIS
jgi:hypothetical protein